MDNITPLVPDTKSSCVITLDPFQFAFYQQSCIELQSPDCQFLELVGHSVQKDIDENNVCRLREQVFLLQALCSKIDQEIAFIHISFFSGKIDGAVHVSGDS